MHLSLASILYSCGILGISLALLHVHGTQDIALATPGFWIPSTAWKGGMLSQHCECLCHMSDEKDMYDGVGRERMQSRGRSMVVVIKREDCDE